jgi:uncharacterized protein (TIGR04222 family)
MNQHQPDLYRQIQDFQLDDPQSKLRFSDRLAREQDWSIGYTRSVIEEYRRFLLLSVVAGHIVTPSDQVDQVWHFHLTYTESYWSDLCVNVLKRPLHHGPTKGGVKEGEKYCELYERTLASYRRVFQQEPPSDIWPPAAVRFGEDLCFQRVNTYRNWVIPKPRWLFGGWSRMRRRSVAACCAVPVVMGVSNPLDWRGPDFLLLFASLFLVALAVALLLRYALRREWGDGDISDDGQITDPYEIAFLADGKQRVIQTATATLMQSGVLSTSRRGARTVFVAEQPLPAHAHKVESAVHAALIAADGDARGPRFQKLVGTTVSNIEQQLAGRGLVETNQSFSAARWSSLIVMTPVLLLGMAKLFVGISRDRPVGFLAVGLFAVGAVMAWLAFSKPRCTRAGKAIWRRMVQDRNVGHAADKEPSGLDGRLAANVALLGLAATFAASDPIFDAFSPKRSGSFVNGGTAGCGGDGCGGDGCGGGGCGGGGCGGGGCGGCGG